MATVSVNTLPPNVGASVSYNGYTFSNVLRLKVTCRPEYDENGWSIRHLVYSITVEDVVADDSSTSTTMNTIRQTLSQPGKNLVISGWGVWDINTGGEQSDVLFGPHPQELAWRAIGGSRASEIIWQCEVHATPCASVSSYSGSIHNYGYSVNYSIDSRGMTTRSVTGYIRITPFKIGNTGRLSDHADNYRDYINVPALPGFRRDQQQYTLSADRTTLNFSIADTQIASFNPYPNECVEIRMTESVRGSLNSGGFNSWSITISGSITPRMDVINRASVWRLWLILVRQRVVYAARGKQANGADGSTVILQDLSVTEDIFGLTSTFSLSYQVLCSLETILTASGMWKPVGTNDWNTWDSGMVATAWRNRGFAGLGHNGDSDAVVEVCGGNRQIPPMEQSDALVYVAAEQDPDDATIEGTEPTPESSWMDYRLSVETSGDENQIRHQTLPQIESEGMTAVREAKQDDITQAKVPGADGGNSTGESPDTIQKTSQSRFMVTLNGFAKRVKYPIPIPLLDTYGTSKAIVVSSKIVQEQVGQIGIHKPIFAAMWRIKYYLESPPSAELEIPPNLTEPADGGIAKLLWK